MMEMVTTITTMTVIIIMAIIRTLRRDTLVEPFRRRPGAIPERIQLRSQRPRFTASGSIARIPAQAGLVVAVHLRTHPLVTAVDQVAATAAEAARPAVPVADIAEEAAPTAVEVAPVAEALQPQAVEGTAVEAEGAVTEL